MSLDVRARAPFAPKLDLPPAFRLVSLREIGDAFAHAQKIAAAEGAGTLVWVGRFDVVEFAVVLEPEEPLAQARRAFYAGMAALVDALSVHAPPEKPIHVDWPDAIRVDGGLVCGAMIRTVEMTERKPGLLPLGAALEEEGFHDLGSGQVVESFARHLMVLTDAWQEAGFPSVAESYLSRIAAQHGVERSIDRAGDLLVRRVGERAIGKRRLVPALAVPSWLDPHTGAPRA